MKNRLPKSQDEIFWNGEGDRWWARNQAKLEAHDDIVMRFIDRHVSALQPTKLLDVGCATGWRAAAIERKYGGTYYGIDGSEKAIAEGRKQFPRLILQRALASALPFADAAFDIVLINFVFHWISRDTLSKTVAELDRVLKAGGHLIIGDFFPLKPRVRKYHHLPEENVMTFKQDYGALFLALKSYTRLEVLEFDHDAPNSAPPFSDEQRAALQILIKKA